MKYPIEYADSKELLEHNIAVYEDIRLGVDADYYCECEKQLMRERLADLKEALAKLQ